MWEKQKFYWIILNGFIHPTISSKNLFFMINHHFISTLAATDVVVAVFGWRNTITTQHFFLFSLSLPFLTSVHPQHGYKMWKMLQSIHITCHQLNSLIALNFNYVLHHLLLLHSLLGFMNCDFISTNVSHFYVTNDLLRW